MKLIDILNKIANGELKEGTKVKYDEETYTFNDENELERELGFTLLDDIYMNNLSDEVELIEPQEPKECEHEWEEYGMYNTKTKEDKHFRKCIKCDLEEEIEPTDNTKIEEVVVDEIDINCLGIHSKTILLNIIDKLNEVIRYINKEE